MRRHHTSQKGDKVMSCFEHFRRFVSDYFSASVMQGSSGSLAAQIIRDAEN
jgi:hypothetical protein